MRTGGPVARNAIGQACGDRRERSGQQGVSRRVSRRIDGEDCRFRLGVARGRELRPPVRHHLPDGRGRHLQVELEPHDPIADPALLPEKAAFLATVAGLLPVAAAP